jgi:hypothetical protein
VTARGALRRGPLAPVAAVLASAFAVVAALTLPAWMAAAPSSGSVDPAPPAPSSLSEAVGSQAWRALGCPEDDDESCAAPPVLDVDGQPYQRGTGRRVSVDTRGDSPRSMEWTVDLRGGSRWILVGAEHAGAGALLQVTFGSADPVDVPAGRLTFLPVPQRAWHVDVRVADVGDPGEHEVLRIEEYQPNG